MAKIWDLTNKELKDRLAGFLTDSLDWNAKVCLQLLEQLKDGHGEVRCEWDRLSGLFGSQTLSRVRACLPGLVTSGALRLLERTSNYERYQLIQPDVGNGKGAATPNAAQSVPYSEADQIILHCNLNLSQQETYRYLVERCLELKTNAIFVTASMVAQACGISAFSAHERLKSLQKTGVIYKVPDRSSTKGTFLRVALKMEDIDSLRDSDVQSTKTVEVERAEKNVIPALIELIRRSGIQLEPREVYEQKLKQAQSDVSYYYQIVQHYDMIASAIRK